MSFLTRSLPAFRIRATQSTRALTPRAAAFSTTFITRKSATETVKDAADTVNKKVGETLVGGIEATGISPSLFPSLFT